MGLVAHRPRTPGPGCHNPTDAALDEHVCAGRAVIAARSARTRGRCAVWPVWGGYAGALAELAYSPESRADLTDGSAVRMSRRYHFLVDRVVHVPYTVEQDETGWWSAHASLPGGGANGEGQTAEEAVADLREALDGWFAEFGVPDELTITVRDVA